MPFIIPFHIPSKETLDNVKLLAEARLRYESRADRDFDSSTDDDLSHLDFRARVGFQVTQGESKLLARWQYSAEDGEQAGVNSHSEIAVPYEFYIDVPVQSARLKAGRQEVKGFGDSRFIYSSSWSTRGTTFDGLRYTSKNKVNGKPAFDAFLGQVGQASSYNEDTRVGAVGVSTQFGQTMFYYTHNNPVGGETNLFTFEHIWSENFGDKLTFNFDGMAQFGDAGTQRKEAWSLHGNLTYQVSDQTDVFVEVNSASGGDSATTDRTFDPFYTSSHSRWGIMDMQTNSNFNHLQVGVEHDWNEKLSSHLSWNKFELRDARDGWYKGANSINKYSGGSFIDPTGTSGRDVGSEIDLYFSYAQGQNTFGLGGGIFLPGNFIESFVPDPDNQVYFYGFWNFRW